MYKSWIQTPIGYELYAQGQYEREFLAFMYGGVYDGWFFYIPYHSDKEILLKAGSLKDAKREVEQRMQRNILNERNRYEYYINETSNRYGWTEYNDDSYELRVKSPEKEMVTAARVEKDEWYGYKYSTLFEPCFTRHILLLNTAVQKMAIDSIREYGERQIDTCEMLILMLEEEAPVKNIVYEQQKYYQIGNKQSYYV